MKKKRINRNLLFMILLLCVTIGYAYLNSELKINGTTGIKANTWDVHFENVVPSSSNTVTPTVAPVANPQDKETELTYEITFNRPGDIYEFTVDVVNAGTIDAMLKLYTSTIKIGDGETKNVTAASIPSYLNYYVMYKDGVMIDNNQILNTSSSEKIIVHIEYKMDITEAQLAASSGKTIEFNIGVQYTQKTSSGVEKPGSLHCTYEGTLTNGATYTNGQYTYTYNSTTEGWSVTLTDKDSTDLVTSKLCATVNAKPIVNMSNMFNGSKTTYIDTRSFNTSKVTDMSNMFANATNLNVMDINTFNTSNVTNMNNMFYNNPSMQVILLRNMDFSNIQTFSSIMNLEEQLPSLTALYLSNSILSEDMSHAFANASNLSAINLDNVNTSKTKDMTFMFRGLSKIYGLDVSSFDMTNVTSIYGLFYECSSLRNIDLSSWNTSNITNMWMLFSGCTNLESINVSGWDMRKFNQKSSAFGRMIGGGAYSVTTSNFPKLKKINASDVKLPGNDWMEMFAALEPVEELILDGIDTSNVTKMDHLFNGCHSLKSLDLSGFNTSNVTEMMYMFSGTYSLSTIDLSSFDLTNVTRTDSMFQGTGATTGYARTQADANILNASSNKPSTLSFIVKP